MIPYIAYYQARKSLEGARKTIEMMGDSSNYMLEAQRDMLELEVEYFRGRCRITTFWLTVITFCVTIGYLYMTGVFSA